MALGVGTGFIRMHDAVIGDAHFKLFVVNSKETETFAVKAFVAGEQDALCRYALIDAVADEFIFTRLTFAIRVVKDLAVTAGADIVQVNRVDNVNVISNWTGCTSSNRATGGRLAGIGIVADTGAVFGVKCVTLTELSVFVVDVSSCVAVAVPLVLMGD